MKISIAFLAVVSLITTSYGQKIKVDENQELTINSDDFYSLKLNDQVKIYDLVSNQSQLNYLNGFGTPVEVVTNIHEGIGEERIYKYDGFELIYSNLSQPELELVRINIYDSNLISNKKVYLETNESIDKYIENKKGNRTNFSLEEELSIKVKGEDATGIHLENRNGKIKQISLIF